ncbi:MAG TPA: nitrite/sulfite reductase, partial [Actinomycetota bacterium]|nr:nitrite/sulfite reductase [Actinomycetota bacterium]
AREAVDGERQAYDVFLRGGVGLEQAVARPLIRRVPFPRVEAMLDGLIGAWLDGRSAGESFRDFCIRTPDADLQALAVGEWAAA